MGRIALAAVQCPSTGGSQPGANALRLISFAENQLLQQAVTRRVVIEPLLAANPLNQKSPKRGEGEKNRWDQANPLGFRVWRAAKCG
jgi:hypothetical protein